MKKTSLLISFLVIAAVCNSQGLIDGFFKGQNHGTVAVSASYQSSTQYWAGDSLINFNRNQPNAGLFGTYGIIDGLDVVASIPFVNLAPQDASLFAKWRAFQRTSERGGKFTLGIAAGMSVPMSNYNTESSTAIGQRATIVEPRVFLQYHFPNRFFIQAQAGYTYAFDPVPSGIPASIKLGYTHDKWYADVWFDLRDSETGKDYTGTGDRKPNSFRELEVDYQRIGATFYKPFSDKFGLSLGLDHTLSGRNMFKSTGVNLGFIRNF